MKLLVTITFLIFFLVGYSQSILSCKEYDMILITNDSIDYLDIGYRTYLAYQAEGYSDPYLFDKSLLYLQSAVQEDSLNQEAHRVIARIYYNYAIKLAKQEVELENPPQELVSKRVEYFRLASFHDEKFQLLKPTNESE